MATNNAVNTSLSGQTGTVSFVGSTSPALTTPNIGVATATSVNKMAITAPATSSTLAVADGKTLTASNTLTFTGTDSSSVNFGAGGTVAYSAQGMAWGGVAGTTQAAAVNSGYIIQNAGATTVTLPATAAVGDRVSIAGNGAGGWVLTANTGQTIAVGISTSSSAGTVTSAGAKDQIEVICVTANTTWVTRFVLSAGVTVA